MMQGFTAFQQGPHSPLDRPLKPAEAPLDVQPTGQQKYLELKT